MKWLMLLIAGILEITWAVAMKYSHGFSLLFPSAVTIITYILSAIFLSLALKQLPLSLAYILWVGFGIIGTSIMGIFLFNEKLTFLQVISILLVLIGIIGLKIFAK